MELGIYDKIIFFGNSTEIEQILSYSDLFLLPSETESFGLAALEAMASGVPVISSNAGGLSEVNENGVSGFLSDVGDVKNMTENALIVLKDKDTLLKYKENAKKVAEKFSIEKVLPLYEDLYQQAIELKKKGM
jgi:glycosyltransferase involved in cell wall biosynthesis